jgi:tetratricopeptide (TPR) repeat protein
METVEQGGGAIHCPARALWIDLAAGLTPSGADTELLAHAARCASCAAILADCVRVLHGEPAEDEDAAIAALQSSRPEWQRKVAALAARSARGRAWVQPAWMAAAAGIALVCGALVLWTRWREQHDALHLLAQAYTAQRTVELRIPGAAYGPVRLERGGASARANRPAELSESEALIRRQLDAHPDDPPGLHAQGRADLLEWNYDDAIQTLRLARDLNSGDPREKALILVDLATAYYERAEAMNRAIDFSMAAELLGQAVQADPSLAAAYFNRALVYEKLFLYINAVSDWKRYLQMDARGAWADEARRRLDELQRKMQVIAPRTGRTSGLVETQLEEAMASGLTQRSLPQLAARLRNENHDLWLQDALLPGNAEIAAALKDMIPTRSTLRVDLFPAELKRLDALDRPGLSPAAHVWLEFERLFRVTHSPGTARCISGLDELIAICRYRQYPWFLAQILLERSSCEMAVSELAASQASIRRALEITANHDLPVAHLRSAGFLSFRMANAGQFREAAQIEFSSLDLFWSQPFPYVRAQQFYNDMDWVNEGLGRLRAAKAAAESAAMMAHLNGAIITEAVNRARWAGYAERLGQQDEAGDQYARSKALFDGLENNEASEEYRAFAEAYVASATGKRNALINLESVVSQSSNMLIVAPYLRAMAESDASAGNFVRAEARITEAIRRIEGSSVERRNPGDVRRWRTELQRDYRELAIEQLRRNRLFDAYRSWQDFLRADGELRGLSGPQPGAPDGGQSAALVTFARLGGRYGVWVRRGSRLDFDWVPGDADSIDRLVRQYAALCSQPRPNSELLRSAGRQLSNRLLAFPLHLASGRSALVVQPDGELSRLPWAALPVESGAYLGDERLVAVSSMQAPYQQPLGLPDARVHRILIVGSAAIDPHLIGDYPPLPGVEDEIGAVAKTFPNSDVLTGALATAENINRHLGQDDALHFTGHAAMTSEGIRLLVAPDPSTSASGFWGPGSSFGARLSLAVLGACSTAHYEEVESPEPADLAEGLLFGGARQVVAALWNVDSAAAAVFMQSFYRNLHLGRTVTEAIQSASREVRERPGWENPYYWAAFSLFVRI